MTGHDDTRRVHPQDLAADEPLPSGAAEPVDVAQVRADEALIEALRGSMELDVKDPIDDRLAGLLQAWRDDIDDEPIKPIDLDVAVAALAQAPRPRRRRWPVGPLASAAAVAAIVVGVGGAVTVAAAQDATPGTALFAITKVVNPEKATSLEAAFKVRQKLDEASVALDSGEVGRASEALEEAKQTLPNVMPDDDDGLADQAAALEDKLNGGTVGTTTPPTSATMPGSTPPSTGPEQSGQPESPQPTTPRPEPEPEPTETLPTTTEQPAPTSEQQPSGGGSSGEPGAGTGAEQPSAGNSNELGGGAASADPSGS